MKTYMKSFGAIVLLLLIFLGCEKISASQSYYFPTAIKTCESYSKLGSIPYQKEVFDVLITLQKKGNLCIYKEKIFQDKKWQMLTCNFEKHMLEPISASMEEYNNYFKKEIAQNTIFEAKMTSNGVVFQKYLSDPKICSISHSKGI